MNLEAYLPTLTGLVLVVIGVLSHDPDLKLVGIGFLGGGVTTGGVQHVKGSRA